MRATGCIVALTLLGATACSSMSAAACEQAALAQAIAEDRWTETLQEHVHTDEAVAADPTSQTALSAHDDSAALLVEARVNMILAEAETRRTCG